MYNKLILNCWIILIIVKSNFSINICTINECVCDQEVSANYITCIFSKNESSDVLKNKIDLKFNKTKLSSFTNVDTFNVIIKNVDGNQVSKKLFAGLDIDYLLMNENSLNKLDFELFKGVSSVKNLYLSNNNLSEMIEFYNFSPNLTSTIESLILKNNSIKKVSSHSLNYLTNLNYLDLSYNQIDDIDADNDLNLNLKTLSTLELSNNKIKSVDFRYFSTDLKNKLDRLNLNSNGLQYLINLNELKNLRYLSLASNKLNELYFSPITKLNHLIKLDLSKNLLKEVHRHMLGHMKNLTKIDFSYNLISLLDGSIFKNFKNLEKLYLQHNLLRKLDLNWFKSSLMLNVLDLSHNQIEVIKSFENSMIHLANLKIIRLSNNKLISLSFDPNRIFPNLRMLYLDHNYIEEFDHQIDLKHLIKVDLSDQNGKLKRLRKFLFKMSINSGQLLKLNLSLNNNLDFDNMTFCIENQQESTNFYLDLIISNRTLVNTNKCILKQLSHKFKRTRLFIVNEQNSESLSRYGINETICRCDFRLFLANFNILVRDICPLYVTYCHNEEFKDECIGNNELKCNA